MQTAVCLHAEHNYSEYVYFQYWRLLTYYISICLSVCLSVCLFFLLLYGK